MGLVNMRLKKKSSQGFTLVAALLIMVLLSGVAAGILYFVTSETRMGGNDLEANLAYYDAESGMEKLTSDLGTLYGQTQVPTNAQIQNLVNFPPTSAMVGPATYTESINYAQNANGTPVTTWDTISSGSNQGLVAEIVPMTLQVIASRPAGAQVNMTRQVEIALIPVFQFGVFCGYDCSYFAGPDFSFGGRVHTNMNLFLASGANLVFNDKVQAFKQILTDELENGWSTSSNYGGTVWVPKSSGGCPLGVFPPTGAACLSLPPSTTVPGDASWSGGYPSIGGAANPSFSSISTGTFNGYLANSLTGVTNLQLQFVTNSCVSNPPPCTDPISIVRKPLAGELSSSPLGSDRLYNKAQIRILIADTLADLHPERGAGQLDAQDYEFPNVAATQVPGTPTEYFGWATAGTKGWVDPYTDSGLQAWAGYPLAWQLTTNPGSVAAMGGAGGGPWIRVEYCSLSPCSTSANWVGVTSEWLGLGIGRVFNNPPTAPGTNSIDANAILILQQLQPPPLPQTTASAHAAGTSGNWYPINFYDAREGEMRDNPVNNVTPSNGTAGYPNTYSSCSVNGIMNAVELDVGNLSQWLKGATGLGTGKNVVWNEQNGYVLYFSDHRGIRASTNASNGGQTPAGIVNGESGIEDVVNSAMNLTSSPGTAPDGVLENTTYYTYSPEDVDQNGKLDNWGEKNLGYGFGINTNINPMNPYLRINVSNVGTVNSTDCASYNQNTGALLTNAKDQMGMANPVSGARHVLKLVDAGMSAAGVSPLPVMPAGPSGCVQNAANPTGCGGFTVASENPVYVQGNYNSSNADTFWGGGAQMPHSAASIIADSVSVLSNSWSDMGSLMWPTTLGNRGTAAPAYYRMAVAGGKNIPFPQPNWAGVSQDFGTDGGMHNFLRYLEKWNNPLNYDGSLVSMYYAEYDTGVFKCCTVVYSPPTRNYYFDVLFLNPNNLPPATPMFQDVVNLSYHQNFQPH